MEMASSCAAVVIVTEETQKGTARSPQEYVNPLLVVSGRDHASISFVELHERICGRSARQRSTGYGTVVYT